MNNHGKILSKIYYGVVGAGAIALVIALLAEYLLSADLERALRDFLSALPILILMLVCIVIGFVLTYRLFGRFDQPNNENYGEFFGCFAFVVAGLIFTVFVLLFLRGQ